MPHKLIRKLEHFTRLASDDRAAIEALAQHRQRVYRARETIINEGDKPEVVNLFLDGWACRYKDLENGKRQIMSIFVPGDICDLNIFILKYMDHSIAALTSVTVVEISRDAFERAIARSPRVMQALWWDTLVTAAVQREWTMNVGQRDARERIAHLICELYTRLDCVGLVTDGACLFPLTQSELGEATGLTPVSVNRVLQDLRRSNLIHLHDSRLRILDLPGLQQAAMFNPNYLHLGQEGSHLAANT